jgi:hypothetical protein
MGLLESSNPAFTKLGTLLAYLVLEIKKTIEKACPDSA